jgi:lathosterol oxidase
METINYLNSLSSEPSVLILVFVLMLLGNLVQYFALHGSVSKLIQSLALRQPSFKRISGKEPPTNQWIKAAEAAMSVQVVFAAVGTLCFWLIFSDRSQVYSDPYRHGLSYLIFSMIGALAIHDLYFYLCHSLLHRNKWMYRKWHSLHHEFREPTTYADHALHPMEALISAAIFPLLMLVLPLHFSVYVVMYLLTAVANIVGHTGREVFPKWMLVHPMLGWLNFTGFHNFHHTHNTGNYGYYTKIWDRLFATLSPAYEGWLAKIEKEMTPNANPIVTLGSSRMVGLRSFAAFMIIGIVVSGCTTEHKKSNSQERAQEVKKNEKSRNESEEVFDDTSDKNGASAGSMESRELCDKLKKDSELSRSWKTEVDQLCAKLLDLRKDQRVYRGNGIATAYIDQSERVAVVVDISRVHLYSSLRQTNHPRYFFEKVKLEVSDPDQFKSSGFEMTPDERDIEFSVLQVDPKFTRYQYLNTAEVDVAIEYEGRSSFYEVVKDDTYAVVSRAMKTLQTIEEFTGLIVIHRIPDTKDIEVFALTIESYRNFGNHTQLVNKLQKKFEDEQTRGFRNGMHAGKIKLGDH